MKHLSALTGRNLSVPPVSERYKILTSKFSKSKELRREINYL